MNIKNIFANILPRLPDGAVKTGESWTTPFDRDVQQGQISVKMKGESSNVLEGVETMQGMECVKIKTQSKYTVEGSGTQMGQALNLKGDGTSASTWYFAYKKGLLVKFTSTADANIKINLGAMEIPQATKTKDDIELVP